MKTPILTLRKKCSLIKLVITDVDGVLTDGGMYYSDKGDVMKRFHTRDGMGVTLLKNQNYVSPYRQCVDEDKIILNKEILKIV